MREVGEDVKGDGLSGRLEPLRQDNSVIEERIQHGPLWRTMGEGEKRGRGREREGERGGMKEREGRGREGREGRGKGRDPERKEKVSEVKATSLLSIIVTI